MAVATPLDIHRDVFPAGSAAFTEAYQIKALIIRREPGYHLGVDRSYAPMIADYLSRTVSL